MQPSIDQIALVFLRSHESVLETGSSVFTSSGCVPSITHLLSAFSGKTGQFFIHAVTGFAKCYLLLLKPVSRVCACLHFQALRNQLYNGHSLLWKSHWLRYYPGPNLQDFAGKRGQQWGAELAVCDLLKPLQEPEHSSVSWLQASSEPWMCLVYRSCKSGLLGHPLYCPAMMINGFFCSNYHWPFHSFKK